jgi:hypothetical protein
VFAHMSGWTELDDAHELYPEKLKTAEKQPEK